MSDDLVLRDDADDRYSYDNIRTQGWLNGHVEGLRCAVTFLREKAAVLFQQEKDEEAVRMRNLATEMLRVLEPQMELRAKDHEKQHPMKLEKKARK